MTTEEQLVNMEIATTIRIAQRVGDIEPQPLQWYRTSEDLPMTNSLVLTGNGWKMRCLGQHVWQALGADGGYYHVNDPEYWCYLPTKY